MSPSVKRLTTVDADTAIDLEHFIRRYRTDEAPTRLEHPTYLAYRIGKDVVTQMLEYFRHHYRVELAIRKRNALRLTDQETIVRSEFLAHVGDRLHTRVDAEHIAVDFKQAFLEPTQSHADVENFARRPDDARQVLVARPTRAKRHLTAVSPRLKLLP